MSLTITATKPTNFSLHAILMNKIVIILSFLLATGTVSAQEIPFETLDSLSKLISSFEQETEAKTYMDRSGNMIELNYPEENFNVYSYDRHATKAIYKKCGGKEILSLTENIDLSKATGIVIDQEYNDVVRLKVYFPKNHISTSVIDDGNIIDSLKTDNIEFFCRYGAVDANGSLILDRMFFLLAELCSKLKVEKGLIEEGDWQKEIVDWNKMGSKEFAAKYPRSVLSAQAREILKGARIEEEAKLKKSQDFILAFAERHSFRPGIPLAEFAALDPKNKDIASEKPKLTSEDGITSAYHRSNMKFFTVEKGPFYLITDDNECVAYLDYIVDKGNYSRKSLSLYYTVEEIKRNVDKQYIKNITTGDDHGSLPGVEVAVPGTNMTIKTQVGNTFDLLFTRKRIPLPIAFYHQHSESLDSTIAFINRERTKGDNTPYDVLEYGINLFGYDLITAKDLKGALKVFVMNTNLYPQAYNTWDSLGECLLLLKRKQEGLSAYRRSLQLNPKNENATKVLNAEQ